MPLEPCLRPLPLLSIAGDLTNGEDIVFNPNPNPNPKPQPPTLTLPLTPTPTLTLTTGSHLRLVVARDRFVTGDGLGRALASAVRHTAPAQP